MIVISRQRDEAMMIGDDIWVTVVDIRGDKVRLGIEHPKGVSVHRKEVYEAIKRETRAAENVRRDCQTKSALPPVSIRPATAADLDAINAIYNHYVHHSTCTYQEEPSTAEERAHWFAAHRPEHPVTVAEVDGEVVGWGSLSRYHARSAYRRTVENSVYVRHDSHRRGIGGALLADLIDRAAALGHHAIIAGIDSEQIPSVALHARFGFVHVGHLREVGFKFGRWLGVIYMERIVGEGDGGRVVAPRPSPR
jgi:L-amino acid N-acyltransferase